MSDIRRKAIEGVAAGDAFTVRRTFTREDVEAFAALSRDRNPVHFDPAFAAAKGFDGPICHGLLVGSLVTEIGGQMAMLASGVTIRFLRPVAVGETVTCRLEVREVDERQRARCSAVITGASGAVAAEVELFGRLPSPGEREILLAAGAPPAETAAEAPAAVLREEAPGDEEGVRAVNRLAFEGDAEAQLVDALRDAGALTLSLVAVEGGRVVGHVGFSPVTVSGEAGTVEAVGLAPIAVLPERQGLGIGTSLVREGLGIMARRGHSVVVVLGHPGFFRRLGFLRASDHGIRWEHEAPDEAFRAIGLAPGALERVRGVVRFRREFDAVP